VQATIYPTRQITKSRDSTAWKALTRNCSSTRANAKTKFQVSAGSKALTSSLDVQKLRIIPDPKFHNDLQRFCQYTQFTRLAFLARNVPPDVLMRRAGGLIAVPVFVRAEEDTIVKAIQRGLRATFDTLSAQVLAWCRMIVELPHQKGGPGIAPLQASAMAAFYSRRLTWSIRCPTHTSIRVAGQNLEDSTTWTTSALQTLQELQDQLLTPCRCTEWAPPLDAVEDYVATEPNCTKRECEHNRGRMCMDNRGRM
jgi:hypothetical protein